MPAADENVATLWGKGRPVGVRAGGPGDWVLGPARRYSLVRVQKKPSGGNLKQSDASLASATEAAEELRRSESRKAAILESALDAILLMDHLGNVVEFNAAAERMFGYRRSDVLGRQMAELIIPPAFREAHRQGLRRYLEGGQERILGRVHEMAAVRSDGSEFPAEFAITRVQGQVPPLFTGYIRDVTARKRASDRAARLLDFTSKLSRATSPEEVVDAVLSEGLSSLRAQSGGVMLVADDGMHLEVAGTQSDASDSVERFRRVPLDASLPVCDAIRSGRAVCLANMVEWRQRHPGTSKELQHGAVIAVPLLVEGRAIGGIEFHCVEERSFDDDESRFAELLANHTAQALERARLFEAEGMARAEIARYANRLELLADASTVFSRVALDFQAALDTAARELATMVGDGCVISLLDDDGTLVAAAHHHRNAEAQLALGGLCAEPRRPGDSADGRVALTGEPFLCARSDSPLWLNAASPRHRLFAEAFPLESLLVVPLRVHGHIQGIVELGRMRSSGPYNSEDVLLVQELADRAALAIENARLFKEARDAVGVRDEFLSIASHELRTPLTALQLQLQGLRRSAKLAAPDSAKLEAAVRQVQRLGRLVEGLLDVSRISVGQLQLVPERCTLKEVVLDVVERMQDKAAAEHCELRLALEDLPAGGWDRMRIEQVLVNLLTNAIKYAPGRPIDVSLRVQGELATLRVDDHGKGIAPEDLERIFGRFERATELRTHGGLGLGLYIARQIVLAHGGRIFAESTPGAGASFIVELPLRGVSSGDLRAPTERTQASARRA